MDIKSQRIASGYFNQFTNINQAYTKIISDLVSHGKPVGDTIELTNYFFTLTNLENNICTVRELSLKYLCGEMLWYFMGDNKVDFISRYASFWKSISDNGVYSNSAYGHILFHRHGFNQVDKIVEHLINFPTSRRAVLNFNVPNPNINTTKDEICTISMTFLIRNGKLNGYVSMRSNDVYYGLPYDVAFFTTLQKYIAQRVGVKVGEYFHQAISLHMYKRDIEKIKHAIDNFDGKTYGLDVQKLIIELNDIKQDPEKIVDDFLERGILYEN